MGAYNSSLNSIIEWWQTMSVFLVSLITNIIIVKCKLVIIQWLSGLAIFYITNHNTQFKIKGILWIWNISTSERKPDKGWKWIGALCFAISVDRFGSLPLFLTFILEMLVSFMIRMIRLERWALCKSEATGKAVFALISLRNTASGFCPPSVPLSYRL